jgi:hypothetical protein
VPSAVSAAGGLFDGAFLPTSITCATRPGYSIPISTYCSQSDLNLAVPHHATSVLLNALAGEPIVRLRLAIWAITDPSFAAALCAALSTETQEVTISVQKDSKSDLIVQYIADCAKKMGAAKVTQTFNGLTVGGINSYHPKLAYIETPTRLLSFIGSGNITHGRMNVDYFVRLPDEAPVAASPLPAAVQTSFGRWIGCVTQKLNGTDFLGTREDVLKIRGACHLYDPADKAFLLPADARRLLTRIAFLGGTASELRIMSQGFSSSDISWIAVQNVRSGRKVRILLDDDIFWAKFDPLSTLMNDEFEFTDFLLPLIEAGVEVRYVVTNHNGIIGNYQHAKFVGFKAATGASTCILGSANSTGSAFSDNVEVMLESNARTCTDSHNWYDDLWARAVPHSDMPKKDPLR